MSNNKTYDLEESVDRKKKNPKRTLRISLIVLLLLIIFALAFFVSQGGLVIRLLKKS